MNTDNIVKLVVAVAILFVTYSIFSNNTKQQFTQRNTQEHFQNDTETLQNNNSSTGYRDPLLSKSIADNILKNSNEVPNVETVSQPVDVSSILKDGFVDTASQQISFPSGMMDEKQYSSALKLDNQVEDRNKLNATDLQPNQDVNEFNMFNIPMSYNDSNLAFSAKDSIGVPTINSTKRNAAHDIRGTIPCPKFVVSPWNNSTIEPDINIKPIL